MQLLHEIKTAISGDSFHDLNTTPHGERDLQKNFKIIFLVFATDAAQNLVTSVSFLCIDSFELLNSLFKYN